MKCDKHKALRVARRAWGYAHAFLLLIVVPAVTGAIVWAFSSWPFGLLEIAVTLLYGVLTVRERQIKWQRRDAEAALANG